MELPDMPIPVLLDETGPSTSAPSQTADPPQPNTGDYVMSLGKIIPLPEKDLEIAPELLQRDPDITEIKQPDALENTPKVSTHPCSVNLRHLDQQDITKWQMQKTNSVLLDTTDNMPDAITGDLSKYRLWNRATLNNSNKHQSE